MRSSAGQTWAATFHSISFLEGVYSYFISLCVRTFVSTVHRLSPILSSFCQLLVLSVDARSCCCTWEATPASHRGTHAELTGLGSRNISRDKQQQPLEPRGVREVWQQLFGGTGEIRTVWREWRGSTRTRGWASIRGTRLREKAVATVMFEGERELACERGTDRREQKLFLCHGRLQRRIPWRGRGSRRWKGTRPVQ